MQRKASAVWKGGLKDGQGTVSSASGILSNTKYSFKTRFEDAPGTNPEELIAAAHHGCASGRGREGAGSERGRIQHRGEECRDGLPGIEGAEREDYDGCEARLAASAFPLDAKLG